MMNTPMALYHMLLTKGHSSSFRSDNSNLIANNFQLLICIICILIQPCNVFSVSKLFILQRKTIFELNHLLRRGHPFREDESHGKAEVYVKDLSGLWKKLGDKRFRIHKDEMIDVVNLLEDGGNYDIELGLFESKSIQDVHKKCLSFINASLAYRDAYLGKNDTIEDARKREDDDTLSLDREWPEEEELLESGIRSFKSKDE